MEKMMKMNSSCDACYLDDNDAEREAPPVKESSASFVKLYKWPESDIEFVIRRANLEEDNKASIRFPFNSGKSPVYHYHECFASRQRFLRSYTFTKKETVGQKAKRWYLKMKKKVVIKDESVQISSGGKCRFVQVIHKFLGSYVSKKTKSV